MPRTQIHLPADLCRAVKDLGLPASELLQDVVRVEVRRRKILAATEEHLAQLTAEVGESTEEEVAAAEALVRRTLEHAKAAAV